MRTWARWTARATLFTASFVAAGVGTVGLASAGTTSGNGSVGGGNQVSVPISIPVSVCGNAVALLGHAFAGCAGGASTSHGGGDGGGSARTSGNYSILGGNQVSVPISIPVDICGNAVALLGHAFAGCAGGASTSHGGGDGGGSARTSGNHSILGGNQASVPISIPVSVCGNAVNSPAKCKGGASVGGGSGSDSSGPRTSGNYSILGGNQVKVPVKVPVDVCGNAVAILGGAFAWCKGGASTGAPMSTSAKHLLAHSTYSGRALSAKSVMRQSAVQLPDSSAVAALARQPVLAGLPVQVSKVTSVAGSAAKPAQAATLLSASTPAPGMGSGSLFALALGALLAGASTLIAAGRRLSTRRAGR